MSQISMPPSLSSDALKTKKVACLVANGFQEQDMVALQRMVQMQGGVMTVIGMTPGLVNSWRDGGWGLNFPVDLSVREALAADFDVLLMPGGMACAQKLTESAHTKRIISGFLGADKPVIMVGESMSLLMMGDMAKGMRVAAPEAIRSDMRDAGAMIEDMPYMVDSSLMSVQNMHDQEMDMAVMVAFMTGGMEMQKAA